MLCWLLFCAMNFFYANNARLETLRETGYYGRATNTPLVLPPPPPAFHPLQSYALCPVCYKVTAPLNYTQNAS